MVFVASTINGYLAKEDDTADFISKEDKERFRAKVLEFGNVILGRRTYEIIMKAHKDNAPFWIDKVDVVVITTTKLQTSKPNIAFSNGPNEAIKILKSKGHKNILLGGGGTVNSSFMKAGLIDEVLIDIEPAILGKGIKMFGESDFEARLKLLDVKKLSENEVQVHFEVER